MTTLPQAFISQLAELLPSEWQQLADAIAGTPPTLAVRVNPDKGATLPPQLERVPWCPYGAYLTERPQFTFDTDLHAGRYYVQDASSMIVHHIIRQLVTTPVAYLDLCAAPGGKTTAAIAALPQGSLTVANEIVPLRASILRENIIKWGSPATVVTHNAPAQFAPLQGFFDIIATDVPCSGEGMMRKDDEAIRQWSPALVQECAARQRQIIADIWPCLRPGGLLIYSTCTYNRHEDEDLVSHICRQYGARTVALDLPQQWHIHPGLDPDTHCYRFMPHLTRGEGLFVSVLRKSGDAIAAWHATPAKKQNAKKAKKTAAAPALPDSVKAWLTSPEQYDYTLAGDEYTATLKPHTAAIAALRACLNVTHCGTPLATVRGKALAPAPALALSTALNPQAMPACHTDYPTAMAYLRGEAITLPPGTPRGHVLLRHQGAALGWANNLGGRANNLYPKPWRVKSAYPPQQKPNIISNEESEIPHPSLLSPHSPHRNLI